MKWLPVFFLLLLSLAGCADSPERILPYRWISVSPRVDSLTLQLEKEFYDYASRERIESDVAEMESLARETATEEMALRSRFWEARLLRHLNLLDSASRLIERTLVKTDSARHPYEFFRLRGLMRQIGRKRDAQSFRDLDQELRYYVSIGDEPMTASSYISLGTILYSIGELDNSLEYLEKADEIHHRLGLEDMVAKNAINIAAIHIRKGEQETGIRMLRDLLMDENLSSDSTTRNLVMRNLYVYTGDVAYLSGAYSWVKGIESRRDLQGLYETLLSSHYDKAGVMDSADIYSRKALANIDHVGDYGYKAMIMQSYAATMEREGKTDSALIYQKRYIVYSDSDYVAMQQAEVLRMANLREVSLAMSQEHARVQKIRFNYLITLFVLIMVASVVFFMLYRRQKRHQIASRDSRLEMEKSRRNLLALMLTIEEKNNLFECLKSDIEKMRRENTISSSEATRLQNTIQTHLAGGEEMENFQQQFVRVYPVFVSRLHAAYPGLADSYVKLATYIYVGLDTNRIARLLVIRPESVKQARWRLRRMMGLDKDTSLDDAIRALGE